MKCYARNPPSFSPRLVCDAELRLVLRVLRHLVRDAARQVADSKEGQARGSRNFFARQMTCTLENSNISAQRVLAPLKY